MLYTCNTIISSISIHVILSSLVSINTAAKVIVVVAKVIVVVAKVTVAVAEEVIVAVADITSRAARLIRNLDARLTDHHQPHTRAYTCVFIKNSSQLPQ